MTVRVCGDVDQEEALYCQNGMGETVYFVDRGVGERIGVRAETVVENDSICLQTIDPRGSRPSRKGFGFCWQRGWEVHNEREGRNKRESDSDGLQDINQDFEPGS